MTGEATPLDFDDFAARRGVDPRGYFDAASHSPASHMSKAAHRRNVALLAARQAEHTVKLAALRHEYDAEVTAGRLRPLTSLERLQAKAAGPDDLPSVQAARRTLARRLVRMAEES